ncbi:S1 family peptidase [Marinobacter halotolerans]|uniref:S1 family peptidase n=1 Tax=Marinobacter halotolerans TaxID=1569211 RepID=UPI001246D4A4|nr:serine protease [Marinobacter halotolerans]
MGYSRRKAKKRYAARYMARLTSQASKLETVEREIAKIGVAPEGKYVAASGDGDRADLGSAVVPIFKQVDDGSLQIIGTGFFICKNGIFVTAAHVLNEAIDDNGNQKCAIVIFQFTENNSYQIRNLMRGVIKDNSDVGVGVCREMKHNKTGELLTNAVLPISKIEPKVNDHVFTYAYPNTVHLKGEKENIFINPRFYEGKVSECFPDGRDSVFLPSRCYQTSIAIHGGASGGPVFNEKGHVVGINSTGFNDCHDISFISSIGDIFDLSIPGIKRNPGADEEAVTIRRLQQLGHVIEK